MFDDDAAAAAVGDGGDVGVVDDVSDHDSAIVANVSAAPAELPPRVRRRGRVADVGVVCDLAIVIDSGVADVSR